MTSKLASGSGQVLEPMSRSPRSVTTRSANVLTTSLSRTSTRTMCWRVPLRYSFTIAAAPTRHTHQRAPAQAEASPGWSTGLWEAIPTLRLPGSVGSNIRVRTELRLMTQCAIDGRMRREIGWMRQVVSSREMSPTIISPLWLITGIRSATTVVEQCEMITTTTSAIFVRCQVH